jgi:hypothetical protein
MRILSLEQRTALRMAAAWVAQPGLLTVCEPAVAAELSWELIENNCTNSPPLSDCTYTQRLQVPGGWLVRSTRLTREQATHFVAPGYPGGASGNYTTGGGLGTGVGLTFLPDPNHAWQPR